MTDQQLQVWWIRLHPNKRRKYAYLLQDFIAEQIGVYVQQKRSYEIYHQITDGLSYRTDLPLLGSFGVDWAHPVKNKKENENRFKEQLPKILLTLAENSQRWFEDIVAARVERKLPSVPAPTKLRIIYSLEQIK